jgi:chromosomal replication initiation ATPase DnaA
VKPRSTDGGYRFENFVVGASNRLAHSAAQRVAESPGAAYNPLFIYGESGLGKTHLAAAIAYHARQSQSSLRVELASAEDIVERLHRAIASGQHEQYAAHFQQVDLLLLDDVQFLTGQRETQSELLRLFNLMQGGGRQLVMTSDRPPADIPDVDQRLVSRLSGGLVVDVGAPDFEMRLAILRNSADERALEFADGVLDEVARLALGNVRELKGALNKLAAYQQLEPSPLSATDVRSVLGDRAHAASGSQPVILPTSRSSAVASVAREYDGFLADVTQELETRVERWRVTLGEACAYWASEGYVTQVLERAMQLRDAPDVNGLLATYASVVEHLRGLEMQAITLDPGVRGHKAFRNPELVAEAQQLLDRALASALPLPAPNPTLSRNRLEAGLANQLALKAADAVIEHPGQRYNPLYLHGPSGTGKTHLAHAIAGALKAARPRSAVACVCASTFVEELVAAMQEGGVERWRARYRAAEVLVIDDLQLLADKERTQEELFHLFNTLHDRGAQIVLTSDRPPRELRGVADRLRSRFEGGLVVALQAPDRLLRERLVQRWLVESGHRDEASLVSYLADREATSAREVSGVITRLAAAADLLAVPLDLP